MWDSLQNTKWPSSNRCVWVAVVHGLFTLSVFPLFFLLLSFHCVLHQNFPRAARRLVCFLLSNHLIVLNSKNWTKDRKKKTKPWSSCLQLQTRNCHHSCHQYNWNECTCVVLFLFFSFLSPFLILILVPYALFCRGYDPLSPLLLLFVVLNAHGLGCYD